MKMEEKNKFYKSILFWVVFVLVFINGFGNSYIEFGIAIWRRLLASITGTILSAPLVLSPVHLIENIEFFLSNPLKIFTFEIIGILFGSFFVSILVWYIVDKIKNRKKEKP